jgi:hypothetical protein
MGPASGPLNTEAAKAAIAIPRVSLLKISEKIAGTIVRAQDPKSPAKKRQIRSVWMSFDTATAIMNIPKPVDAIMTGRRRPFNSEKGAQKSLENVQNQQDDQLRY